jgi:hypothetical protein
MTSLCKAIKPPLNVFYNSCLDFDFICFLGEVCYDIHSGSGPGTGTSKNWAALHSSLFSKVKKGFYPSGHYHRTPDCTLLLDKAGKNGRRVCGRQG